MSSWIEVHSRVVFTVVKRRYRWTESLWVTPVVIKQFVQTSPVNRSNYLPDIRWELCEKKLLSTEGSLAGKQASKYAQATHACSIW